MRIYVGNLDFEVTEEALQQLFSGHGQVESVSLMVDRDTQRSKGFAFVEMSSTSEAQLAIQALNGQEFRQRALTVNEARPKEERNAGNTGSNSGPYRPGFRSNNQRSNSQRSDKKGPAKRTKRQRR